MEKNRKSAKRIIELRKEHNLTQEEMAEKILVTPRCVQKWESGETKPEIENFIRLSERFNVEVGEIY